MCIVSTGGGPAGIYVALLNIRALRIDEGAAEVRRPIIVRDLPAASS